MGGEKEAQEKATLKVESFALVDNEALLHWVWRAISDQRYRKPFCFGLDWAKYRQVYYPLD
jgi:hypothetical protein